MTVKKEITFLIVFMLMLQPVFVRAGGGGGHSSLPHTSYQRGNGSPVVGIIGVSACIGMTVYWRRKKARLMHQEIEENLLEAYSQDTFWNEKKLKKKVREQYFIIQNAWSNQDIEILKQHLSEYLYEQWQMKIEWQQFQEQSNLLEHIQLFKVMIVDLYDAIDNHQDYFWVYIEGKMQDSFIEEGQVTDSHNETFVGYWKFIRHGNDILLDEMKQQGEVESCLDLFLDV